MYYTTKSSITFWFIKWNFWTPKCFYRASLDPKQRGPAFFLKGIRQIGKLFDYDVCEPYDYAGFDQILRELDTNFNIHAKFIEVSMELRLMAIFNWIISIYSLLYKIWWWWWAQLAPQCSEVLLRCVWKGTVLNCSNEKTAFRQVVSETGTCCLFNSFKVLDKFTFTLFQ